MLRFIGIDPGLEGAIVAVDRDGSLFSCDDIPNVKTGSGREMVLGNVVRMIARHVDDIGAENLFCTLEKHTPRPGQGISSQCKLARICGQLEGVLAAYGVPYQLMHPRTWSKVMRDVPGTDLKSRAILSASRRFPTLDLSKKKHHNRADAALIAEFGRLYHDSEA